MTDAVKTKKHQGKYQMALKSTVSEAELLLNKLIFVSLELNVNWNNIKY